MAATYRVVSRGTVFVWRTSEELSGELAGTSSFAFTPTGTLTGTGALAGTSSFAFSPSGTLSDFGQDTARPTKRFYVLTSRGYLSIGREARRSTATSIGALAGTSAMAFAASGALTGTGALAGTSALVFSASGALTGTGALAGTSAMVFSPSGTLSGLAEGAMTGASSMIFAATGALTGTGALIGTTTVTFAPSATLTGTGALAGTSAAAFSPTGTLTAADTALIGSCDVLFSIAGTLTDANAIVAQEAQATGGRPSRRRWGAWQTRLPTDEEVRKQREALGILPKRAQKIVRAEVRRITEGVESPEQAAILASAYTQESQQDRLKSRLQEETDAANLKWRDQMATIANALILGELQRRADEELLAQLMAADEQERRDVGEILQIWMQL